MSVIYYLVEFSSQYVFHSAGSIFAAYFPPHFPMKLKHLITIEQEMKKKKKKKKKLKHGVSIFALTFAVFLGTHSRSQALRCTHARLQVF